MWFLFPDQDLDCPGSLDMMAPRLRPVRAPPLEESVGKGVTFFQFVLFYLQSGGNGWDIRKGNPGSTDCVFPTDASTASPSG